MVLRHVIPLQHSRRSYPRMSLAVASIFWTAGRSLVWLSMPTSCENTHPANILSRSSCIYTVYYTASSKMVIQALARVLAAVLHDHSGNSSWRTRIEEGARWSTCRLMRILHGVQQQMHTCEPWPGKRKATNGFEGSGPGNGVAGLVPLAILQWRRHCL